MSEEVDEIRDSLDDITLLLTRSSSQAFKFKTEIMGINKIVSGKNYEILSRFLSGTGAWRVLNKAKASILTMVQLMDRAERSSLAEAQKFQSLQKALEQERKLMALQKAIQDENIESIKDSFKNFDALAKVLGSEQKALEKISKMTTDQLKIQKEIVEAATDDRGTLTRLKEWAEGTKIGTRITSMARSIPTEAERKQITLLYALTGTNLAILAKNNEAAKYLETISNRGKEVAGGIKGRIGGLIGFARKKRDEEIEKQGLGAFEGSLINKGISKIFGFSEENVRMFRAIVNLNMAKQGIKEIREKIQAKASEISTRVFSGLSRNSIKKFFKKTLSNSIKLVQFLMRALLYFTVIITGLFLVYRIFKAIQPQIEEGFKTAREAFNAFSVIIGAGLELIGSGIQDIRNGFANGDYFSVIWGILQVFGGVITTVIGVAVSVIAAILGGIAGLLLGQWDSTKSIGSNIANLVRTAAYVLTAVAFLAAFFVGFPAIIAGLFFGAIAILIETLAGKLGFFANGGVTRSGLSIVGERGPELVRLPKGTRVHSNTESKQMLSNAGGNTIHVHVNGRVGASDAEIRDIANKVAREINVRMNRTSSTVSML